MIKKLVFSILCLFLITACSEKIPHLHTVYTYTIKYGKSLDNLDKVLTITCDAYRHDRYDYRGCPETTDRIDRYICGVDSKLYIVNSVSGYKSSSTSLTNLDGIYCETSVKTKSFTAIYHDPFFGKSSDHID